ncbi:IclR family transcriptional regulator [Paraburkholderia panacisoli]|uniref:IclR family transcriptional regulator n=1 Tax=Paraburkholderia panacisoli TaxID=2603818 RepID=A0A5B0GAR6_9BURK|nr:IclR family transcriptional regulator [Paraburkholderia panacisoli]KAA0999150.1 IclR family transcriptional regulator [Paraburkholderia panacisoli]
MPSARNGNEDTDAKHGVQAAETVLQVLTSFIDAEPMPTLKNLSERIGMHPAKAHRYLVSLCRMGYVEQDPETSRYRLGPLSLRLGLAAISTVDVIRVAKPMMHEFCEALGHTTILAIWNNGPTIVLKETAGRFVMLTAVEGAVLPLFRTAIGRTFGAWMPRKRTENLLARELAQYDPHPKPGFPTNFDEAELLFSEIRKRGLARITDDQSKSIHALSAPIFDGSSELVAALCVVGPAGEFDSSWSGTTAKGLQRAAGLVSKALGYSAKA